MVSEKLQEVFILEDDVDFEPNFCDDLEQVLEEAYRLALQWDLMSVKCNGTLGNRCARIFLHRANPVMLKTMLTDLYISEV